MKSLSCPHVENEVTLPLVLGSASRGTKPTMKSKTVRLLIGIILGLSPILTGQVLAVKVQETHPRLFFRSGPWGAGGLTLETIRNRASDPRSAGFLEKLQRTMPNLALRHLLIGDEEAANEAVAALTGELKWKEITTDEGVELAWRAMAFDWLYDRIPASDRKTAAEIMVKGCDILIRELESGGHIFHTRMYGWATGITLVGLALEGDHPEAERLWRYGSAYYVQNLFPARRLQGGAVHNGFGYGRKYTVWMTGHFISAWLSATGENLWGLIREEQDDWAENETLFTIYGRYPDGSYLRFGDAYSIRSDIFSFRAVAERTAAYRDPVGQGFLQELLTGPELKTAWNEKLPVEVLDNQTGYAYFLFFDPGLPSQSPETLPTKAIFGRNGPGMVIWKSGWGPQDTTVFFKCGNYFGDHGHFDQGHFDVFRRAPLLIDSGSYLTFDGPFRTEYWHRTVAHNSILINDPRVQDEGGQRVFHAQSDATMAEYLANPLPETGQILDYRETPGLAYVAGDYTKAYTPERVERITRELAFVDDRYLVVVDRITVADPDFIPSVLWHCPVQPTIDSGNHRFNVAREGAHAEVRTLWPRSAGLRWVEGFQSAGKTILPQGKNRPLEDMGVGRVEVTEAGGKKSHLFIHVVDVADDGTPVPDIQASETGNGIQVRIGFRSLHFASDRPGLVP